MKIAMVSEHASPLGAIGGVDAGGQNVHVAALASALAARGHEIVVYTRRDSAELADREPLCPGVVVEHLDAGPAAAVPKDELAPYLPAMADDLTARLARFDPAVVHAHFWMSGLVTEAAARAHDLPWVQTFHALGNVKRRHQGAADTSPPGRVDAEARLARSATRVTASCTDELRELLGLGAERARVDIVASGVDTRLFTPDGPAAARCTRHRVLVVGRLVPRKGVDDAIRALPDLPHVELVVAGGPDPTEFDGDPEIRRLAALADELGVARQLRLFGRVAHDELPALMRSADLVVCLPWYEPFGIVPLEAMACGVPVVGTAVGGLLDTVVDGVTGVLLPPRSPHLVARAVRELLADDRRRRRLGRAGVRRAANYTWGRAAAATERTYLRALAATRALPAGASTAEEIVG